MDSTPLGGIVPSRDRSVAAPGAVRTKQEQERQKEAFRQAMHDRGDADSDTGSEAVARDHSGADPSVSPITARLEALRAAQRAATRRRHLPGEAGASIDVIA